MPKIFILTNKPWQCFTISQKFGMCISLNLLQENIITLLLVLLYLLSRSIPYSEHTDNNIDKPIDEGAMSTKSSAYIKWLINEEPIILSSPSSIK
ncbi:hypothetical protein NP493_1029g04015 [Ridgeia piscesae]|uniref:Uncharacterized protein n=1 Tax=Ridgeia piscesae TaxID=27915 RepID=A0AAD9NKM0_RIDPI|nr:hypothetical protein NP493_1029g04015 [Ridgeia piscesae]